MSERIAIVGARNHPNLDIVRAYVRTLPAGSEIVSGGAEGVDLAAVHAARDSGLGSTAWLPHMLGEALYGASYAPRDGLLYRNTLIAIDCTRMVVFPDGSKGGCWDAAREAVRFRRPVEVRWADGRVEAFAGGRGR